MICKTGSLQRTALPAWSNMEPNLQYIVNQKIDISEYNEYNNHNNISLKIMEVLIWLQYPHKSE